jgi:putative Mg2+ transporter-C (MgtC) family protein
VWDLAVRLLGAGALGGLVGLERELSEQPAGLRTHLLVALGAALFTAVGADPASFGLADAHPGGGFDPTRVASQVVSGIGFLGAGAILHHGLNVRGLTTAAALWVSAAVGMAAGLGRWTPAVLAAVLTVLALRGLKRVETRVGRRGAAEWRFVVTTAARPPLASLLGAIEHGSAELRAMRTLESTPSETRIEAVMSLRDGEGPARLAQALVEVEGVRGVDYHPASADAT